MMMIRHTARTVVAACTVALGLLAAAPAHAGWYVYDGSTTYGSITTTPDPGNTSITGGTEPLNGASFAFMGDRSSFTADATETHTWHWQTEYAYDPETGDYYQMDLDEDPPVAEDWCVEVGDLSASFTYSQYASEPGSGSVSLTVSGPENGFGLSGSASGTPDRWEYYQNPDGTFGSRQTSVYSFPDPQWTHTGDGA